MPIISPSKVKVLRALKDAPCHGYEIYQRTKISLGSIYDHLNRLERDGYVQATKQGRKKVYRLTKRGEMLLKAVE